jgi:ribonuclease D
MKDGFGNTEHSMWANAPPLPDKHLEYAARDAYATYEVYRRLDVYERRFFFPLQTF